MADERVVRTRMEFELQRAQIDAAERELGQLRTAYEELEHAQKRNDVIADTLTSSLNAQAQAAGRVATAAKTATNAPRGINAIEQGRKVGDVGSLFSAVGGLNAVGGLGGVFGELGQLGDIAQYIPQAAEGFNQLAASLGTSTTGLIGVAGVAAVAVGAVAIALHEYNKSLDVQREKLKGALSAQETYYEATATLTEDQARDEIEKRKRANETLAQQIAETQGAIDRTFEMTADQLSDPLARILAATGQLPTAQLEEQLKKLREEFTTNEQAAGRLEQGLENGAFAAKTMSDAETELAKKRAALADQIFGTQLNTLLQANNMSSEQLKERIKAIEYEIEVNRSFLQSGTLTDQQTEQLTNRITQLGVEAMTLQAQVAPLIEQREKEAQQVENLRGAMGIAGQAIKGFFAGLENVAELSDKRADEIAKTQAALDDLASKNTQKLADIETTRIETIEQARQNQRESELKAQEDFQKAQTDAERKYRDEVKRIQRDSNRELSDAIANRDVLAYKQAQQSRDDQLSDAKSNFEEAKRANRENLRQQLKDAQDAARKQIQLANDAARKQIELANRQYQQEVAARQAALNTSLQQIQQAAAAEITIRNQLNSATLAGLNILVNQVKGLFGGSGTGTVVQSVGNVLGAATGSNLISSGLNLLGGLFADGGSFDGTRPIVVGERGAEVIFPRAPGTVMNQQQLAAAGGLTFNITGNTRRQILDAVDRKLQEIFD